MCERGRGSVWTILVMFGRTRRISGFVDKRGLAPEQRFSGN